MFIMECKQLESADHKCIYKYFLARIFVHGNRSRMQVMRALG